MKRSTHLYPKLFSWGRESGNNFEHILIGKNTLLFSIRDGLCPQSSELLNGKVRPKRIPHHITSVEMLFPGQFIQLFPKWSRQTNGNCFSHICNTVYYRI